MVGSHGGLLNRIGPGPDAKLGRSKTLVRARQEAEVEAESVVLVREDEA